MSEEDKKDIIPTHVPTAVTEAGDNALPTEPDMVPPWGQELLDKVRDLADDLTGVKEAISTPAPHPVTESPEEEKKEEPITEHIEEALDEAPIKPPWTHRGWGH